MYCILIFALSKQTHNLITRNRTQSCWSSYWVYRHITWGSSSRL